MVIADRGVSELVVEEEGKWIVEWKIHLLHLSLSIKKINFVCCCWLKIYACDDIRCC